ncbi:phenylacetic acid degradation bifunctional protein PaaZ [Salaquimonas pukyongi]|uniref:phenylacetic acid degradation bifunctional protein PaaZ n=1 Tax=Salaquimonas pukyongi TaxID=2712698 RepID=UPI00096B6BDE|nr:phenylacetic acid degradation bifunctional protein PaaZ [Salaquimonas pukyongi]
MEVIDVNSFALGGWAARAGDGVDLPSAINGATVARLARAELDFAAMRDFARKKGGPALRAMTFHERAKMLKALALYLGERKEALYAISRHTGATLNDSRIDIDGGIGTVMVYASKGRREMPDGHVYVDGAVEQLSRNGTFAGQHICVPLQGVAVHINAYNFPVWGMLEKLAPTLLAGVPAIVKPATATSYLTHACFALMIESGLLPEGSVQLVCGSTGNLLDLLDCQDVVGFTGSAATALKLRSHPGLLEKSVRFTAEQDSLNATLLGPDVAPDSEDFDCFVKEVVREITTKAGQKCTAIRRILVPQSSIGAVTEAITARLEKIVVGDPDAEGVRMGALVSLSQRDDVLEKAAQIAGEAEQVFGESGSFSPVGEGTENGAFLPPMLYHCSDPDGALAVHSVEAFGPVSTVMGYRDLAHGCAILNRGGGSLVASLFTADPEVARTVALESAAWHGRLYVNNAHSMAEATGHGAPMPHMVHGGPGRAGGGEELGGIRGVVHYMQRTAVQGSSDILTGVTGQWVPGAKKIEAPVHPFTRKFGELQIGESIAAGPRTVTLEDIEHFAEFTGDTFYAHMDEEAAKANPFFPGRVAHGYLLLSFAAGLFVQPDPGPVLANTGLTGLSFMKPVSPGDAINVTLTVKRKTKRTADYGEVRWHVALSNQDGEKVAEYELHTMNAY